MKDDGRQWPEVRSQKTEGEEQKAAGSWLLTEGGKADGQQRGGHDGKDGGEAKASSCVR